MTVALLPRASRSPFAIVGIAASAGGLGALRGVLSHLPASFPVPILVVQHLSAAFRSFFPELLQPGCALRLHWARDGQAARPGHLYFAPADRHVEVDARRVIRLSRSEKVQFCRPSADVLFTSLARSHRRRAIGVVLSGMGSDGSRGVLAMKRQGAFILAQDQASSRAFGMPGAAQATGCVDLVLPLKAIAHALTALAMVWGVDQLLRVDVRPRKLSPASGRAAAGSAPPGAAAEEAGLRSARHPRRGR